VNIDNSYTQLLWLAVLILLSGFFSAGETALFSLSKVRARHLAKVGGRREKLIKQMKEDPHRLLSTILIGNNLVNVAAASLATAYTIDRVSHHAVGIATGVITLLILVFGEIFPKSLATRNNVLIARLVIIPIRWLSIVFFPLTLLLNFIPRLTAKIQQKSRATEQELLTYVEMVEEDGQIDKEEKHLQAG
jgi:Mg2+/Co2+ transporter CorB